MKKTKTITRDPALQEAGPQSSRLVNREASWLDFNERVLALADDEHIPLLERLHYLSIFSSNLDEFVQKRVGGLKQQLSAGVNIISPDGLSTKDQLKLIREKLDPLLDAQEHIFAQKIRPALATHGIELLHWRNLTEEEKKAGTKFFHNQIFPTLTPLAVDSGRPFPFLSNLSISLGVALENLKSDRPDFARIKISALFPQWIRLPELEQPGKFRFLSTRGLIVEHVNELFPGMNIVGKMLFRVTRNADIEVENDDASDLLELVSEELKQRRFAEVVRLEYGPTPDPWVFDFLSNELSLHENDVYQRQATLDYTGLAPIYGLDIPELRFSKWSPVLPKELHEDESVFTTIKRNDVLVHHPYESFSASLERFVRESAEDPDVLAIKMTLYRVGDETPLIPLLVRAAEEGKQVVCLVELTARFDEERNIQWAQRLERAGVHVVYGIPGLKIHAKTLLVVRRESDGVNCYAHIGTGNYHIEAASLYTDFGLFTCRKEVTEEIIHIFNFLSGRSKKADYQELMVAPTTMNTRLKDYIEQEIKNADAGKPARIIAKLNSLQDTELIDALYRASKAGVKIDLLVRGLCCLKAGVPGLSESIRVVSTLGRFLEHSRIYYFRNGAANSKDGKFYISSADWMYRNIHRRIEVAVPITRKEHRETLWQTMKLMLSKELEYWEMQPDGTYTRQCGTKETPYPNVQSILMEAAKSDAAKIKPKKRKKARVKRLR